MIITPTRPFLHALPSKLYITNNALASSQRLQLCAETSRGQGSMNMNICSPCQPGHHTHITHSLFTHSHTHTNTHTHTHKYKHTNKHIYTHKQIANSLFKHTHTHIPFFTHTLCDKLLMLLSTHTHTIFFFIHSHYSFSFTHTHKHLIYSHTNRLTLTHTHILFSRTSHTFRVGPRQVTMNWYFINHTGAVQNRYW